MKRSSILCSLLLAAAVLSPPAESRIMLPAPQPHPAAPAADPLAQAAHDALSETPRTAQSAIARLRAAGPAGLDALTSAHAPALAQLLTTSYLIQDGKTIAAPRTPEQQRLRAAIDAVAMQRDAAASRLYWYTDLSAALAQSARTGRPILSLRMLGKLNDDLSCANSRFFRTTLYANAAVSQYLRDHFILHWESVRPVPVITIDMGDGRKVVRTITGNSIHYILDNQGRIIDALPGLYGATAFLNALKPAASAARNSHSRTDDAHLAAMREFWADRLSTITAAWQKDLDTLGIPVSTSARAATPPPVIPAGAKVPPANRPPNAAEAGRISVGSKLRLERPLIESVLPDSRALAAATPDDLWPRIAALHAPDAQLDQAARALIAFKAPAAVAAMEVTRSKALVEAPMLRMVRNLQHSIALDTVKNEYTLHTQLYQWLTASPQPLPLKEFNNRVYADLFLTPNTDPWLGLVPPDTFAALDNDGICPTPTPSP